MYNTTKSDLKFYFNCKLIELLLKCFILSSLDLHNHRISQKSNQRKQFQKKYSTLP